MTDDNEAESGGGGFPPGGGTDRPSGSHAVGSGNHWYRHRCATAAGFGSTGADVEVVKVVLQEHFSKRTVEQQTMGALAATDHGGNRGDVTVSAAGTQPSTNHGADGGFQCTTGGGITTPSVDELIVDGTVPRIVKEVVVERVPQCTKEQIVGVSMPQVVLFTSHQKEDSVAFVPDHLSRGYRGVYRRRVDSRSSSASDFENCVQPLLDLVSDFPSSTGQWYNPCFSMPSSLLQPRHFFSSDRPMSVLSFSAPIPLPRPVSSSHVGACLSTLQRSSFVA